ncbi:chromosome segregation protein ParM (plasmid) [Streptomyces sp. NBC_01724]|uniref:chromosome segregation protein ParM n=1 Tax=Streptomyces sp. NBC_01724 TaxID=2975922 RepID=UPI002E2FA8AC|nr:chromosome segregation protein ParM [Streptomyces sp. NBC_01724]
MSIPRSVVVERIAYTLAAPVLATLPNIAPDGPTNTVVLLAGAFGIGGAVLAVKSEEDTGPKLVRLSPVLLAAAVDVAAQFTPGWGWDALLAAGWAAAGWLVLPLSRSARRRFRPALGYTPAPQLQPAPEPALVQADDGTDSFTRRVRILWERAGAPGRTVVVKATPHSSASKDLTMLLRAAEPGRPISGLTQEAVAAAFVVEAAEVGFFPVARQNGRLGGPGWLEVAITPDAHERRRKNPTDIEKWADTIGATGIPGSEFVRKMRVNERGVTFWTASMPDSMGEPQVNLPAVCKALGASYEDGRVFVTLDGPDILVSVWDASPLAKVYPATRELLTPDAEGRWVTGYLTNGQPARNRVYTDRGAAHGLYVAPSGGGKTQLMALSVCADANYGAVVWLATETGDEKTAALGKHIDRQGAGALYMVRCLRAILALLEIRSEMPWADGEVHDWSPGAAGCPYSPLSQYLDEFLSAARHGDYGAEIMDLAEQISVKGRKYGIGLKVAGQSIYVQDGFTQLLVENLRDNSTPVVLKVAPKKIAEMFKALGVAPEDTPDPLPRSFSKAEAGRIERIMNGEPEPAVDSNTGGVGWIVESRKPEIFRTLFMDYVRGIGHLFRDEVTELTDHEIAMLAARDLWFDWTLPPRPGEFGPEPDDEDEGEASKAPAKGKRGSGEGKPGSRHDAVTSPRQALEAIKKLTGV